MADKLTASEAATRLDGGEYSNEGSHELFAEMKAAGLVAVFGASDDLMELRGAVHDEVGCYGGGIAYFTKDGLLTNDCDSDDRCPYFHKIREAAAPIESLWDDGGFSWRYKTSIPHHEFKIFEDGEPYCEGIVFALQDVEAQP